MLPKKRQSADLEKKKSLFFEIGLAIALLLVLIAFKWRVPINDTEVIVNPQELTELEEIVPITRQELTKKFERIARGWLSELALEYADRKVKGEVTLVVAGNHPKFSRESNEEAKAEVK